MDFLLNNIWSILAMVFVIWFLNKFFSDKPGSGSRLQNQISTNKRFHEMEGGNFTDQELKEFLPGQKILAVTLVRKKYGMGLREALAYVENIEHNRLHSSPAGGVLPVHKFENDGSISDDLRERVKRLKDSGELIEAIKELRKGVDIDLLRAKEYVDKL